MFQLPDLDEKSGSAPMWCHASDLCQLLVCRLLLRGINKVNRNKNLQYGELSRSCEEPTLYFCRSAQDNCDHIVDISYSVAPDASRAQWGLRLPDEADVMLTTIRCSTLGLWIVRHRRKKTWGPR